jgi:hypothetical protein
VSFLSSISITTELTSFHRKIYAATYGGPPDRPPSPPYWGTHRSNHADDIDRDRHHRHQHVLDRIAVKPNLAEQADESELRDRPTHRSRQFLEGCRKRRAAPTS